MKTLKATLAAGALALMLAACSNPPSGKPLADLGKLSQADSLSYLYGMSYADNYWRMAQSDSAAAGEAGRKEYLKGIQKGLALASESDQYNEGLLMGLQVAVAQKNLQKELGVTIEPEMFTSGLAYGLQADTVASDPRYQQQFQRIVDAIGKKKDKENADAAGKALAAAARQQGMAQMGPDVFGKVITPGEGVLLQTGQTVNVDMKLLSLSGKELPIPMPKQINVGHEFADLPIGPVILKMHEKEKMELLTPAFALFGQNCSRLGLEPTEVVKVLIETKGL